MRGGLYDTKRSGGMCVWQRMLRAGAGAGETGDKGGEDEVGMVGSSRLSVL